MANVFRFRSEYFSTHGNEKLETTAIYTEGNISPCKTGTARDRHL